MLTLHQIRTLRPRAKPYKFSDGKGLFLLVQPNGSLLWRFRYRLPVPEEAVIEPPSPSPQVGQRPSNSRQGYRWTANISHVEPHERAPPRPGTKLGFMWQNPARGPIDTLGGQDLHAAPAGKPCCPCGSMATVGARRTCSLRGLAAFGPTLSCLSSARALP